MYSTLSFATSPAGQEESSKETRTEHQHSRSHFRKPIEDAPLCSKKDEDEEMKDARVVLDTWQWPHGPTAPTNTVMEKSFISYSGYILMQSWLEEEGR